VIALRRPPNAVLALAVLASACDLGPRDDAPAQGPALHLVASYPADGQGTLAAPDADLTCDSPTPDCPVPTNLVIELRFDRFLLPSGALASGARLYTGNASNGVSLKVEYDLIERVVRLRPARSLEPHTLYTAEVVPGADRSQGFWAFDGAPLAEAAVPLRFGFTTGGGPRAVLAAPAGAPDTCETMTNGPLQRCSACHVARPSDAASPPANYPPMGLDLASSGGLSDTAIGHVAHETDIGDSSIGAGLRAPARFGVHMNLVDPGNPATSYLMYKLLRKPENFQLDASEAGCVTGYHAPVAEGGCAPPDADESVRLREWFVLGDAMPKDLPGDAPPASSTTHADLVRIAAWIAAGAGCPNSGSAN
jgi:hypothetical protein